MQQFTPSPQARRRLKTNLWLLAALMAVLSVGHLIWPRTIEASLVISSALFLAFYLLQQLFHHRLCRLFFDKERKVLVLVTKNSFTPVRERTIDLSGLQTVVQTSRFQNIIYLLHNRKKIFEISSHKEGISKEEAESLCELIRAHDVPLRTLTG